MKKIYSIFQCILLPFLGIMAIMIVMSFTLTFSASTSSVINNPVVAVGGNVNMSFNSMFLTIEQVGTTLSKEITAQYNGASIIFVEGPLTKEVSQPVVTLNVLVIVTALLTLVGALIIAAGQKSLIMSIVGTGAVLASLIMAFSSGLANSGLSVSVVDTSNASNPSTLFAFNLDALKFMYPVIAILVVGVINLLIVIVGKFKKAE